MRSSGYSIHPKEHLPGILAGPSALATLRLSREQWQSHTEGAKRRKLKMGTCSQHFNFAFSVVFTPRLTLPRRSSEGSPQVSQPPISLHITCRYKQKKMRSSGYSIHPKEHLPGILAGPSALATADFLNQPKTTNLK